MTSYLGKLIVDVIMTKYRTDLEFVWVDIGISIKFYIDGLLFGVK